MMASRRLDIEGLRGLAILMVVSYHAQLPFASGGFVGVDIFFAISGYLIAGQLARELAKTGTVRLVDFYARRARRLLPAAALTILGTFIVARLVLSPLEQANFAGTALAAGLYVTNFWFAQRATDYLAAPPESNPLLHMWSLAVEEQFYLVWPVLLLVAWRAGRLVAALGVTAAVVISSIGLMLHFNNTEHAWTFFGPHTRAWEFGVGALAALMPWTVPRWIAVPASWTGLAAMLFACVTYDAGTPFPGVATLPPVVGAAFILTARDRRTTAVLSHLHRLGRVSYSWYLWHWPAVVFAATLVPSLTPVWRGAASVVALLIAMVMQATVEDRIRFSVVLRPRPALTLALAAMLTFAMAGLSFAWLRVTGTESARPAQAAYLQAREDYPAISLNGCHLSVEATAIPECVFGARASSIVVVLYGDSHAAQWFPALEALSVKRNWRLLPMTKMGCPAADVPVTAACNAWRREVTSRIHAMRPALVFVASASVYLTEVGRLAGVSDDAWSAGTRRAMQGLGDTRTVMLLDLPQPGFDPAMCLARRGWHPWLRTDCRFSRTAVASVTRAARLERTATADLSHVRLLDLSDAVCPTDRCDPMPDGLVLYRDANHITAAFSATLDTVLATRLDELSWH